MNVLSLFDGISCGQIALNKCGIKYDNYYASEIEQPSIKITNKNYPGTIQLGNILTLNGSDLPKIELLIGGSPCQGFSSAGKLLNFNDPRSKLFFEYVRLLNECQPKYFLLENVSMIQEWQDIISKYVGVSPIAINSKLVSAQDRKRLYWTNIPNIQQPEDKNIKFSEIVSDGWFCGGMRGRRINPKTGKRDDYNKSIPIIQYIECREDDKSNCLTTVAKDNVAVEEKTYRRPISEVKYRYLTVNEYEKLQTIPLDYTQGVSDNQRKKMIGNAWTVNVISHILSHIV